MKTANFDELQCKIMTTISLHGLIIKHFTKPKDEDSWLEDHIGGDLAWQIDENLGQILSAVQELMDKDDKKNALIKAA